jgi:crotonobetainyl-CoA:carnitine CoA-transferase CaiB-like acyl-CoA transferase
MGGALDLIGERGGHPVIPLNLIADYASATLHGVIGILMGIIAREKTGRGQHIDVSYVDGVMSLLGAIPSVAEYLLTGKVPKRGEGMLGGAYPYYNFYGTKDGGYIALGCIEHHFWDNLCRALNREDLTPYKSSPEHFANPPGEEWEWVRQELAKIFRTRTKEEWFEFLTQYDIPVSKVNNIAEAFSDPQTQERGMIQEIEDPELGKVKQVGFPIKFSEMPVHIPSTAPRPGQHTLEILRSLGYDEARINELIQKKVTKLAW